MAKAYSIETVFKLIDRVSAPTSKINKALDRMGIKSKTVSNALKRDFDKAAVHIDRLGVSAAKFAKKALLGLIPAGIGVGLLTKQFIEFDSQLYKAGSIFSDLNPLADDFKTRLDAIGKAARNVAAKTEFNAEQTASALAVMAQAGIKSGQAIALLPKVADMATAACVDLDNAVGMATGALNVFGKMTDDPLKLAKNLQYVSDVMVKGANLADMSLSEMSMSVSTGGAGFKEANQRIEDYIAAIDILASVNKKGAEAGNAVSAMMTRLAAKPGNVSKALNELGIRTQDAQGNMLNFVDIMGQLNVAMKGMGTAKKDEYLFRIFGQNRINYARPLIDAGVEGFRTYSRELDKAAESTAIAADAMRKSIKNKLAFLGSAATEMGFKFIEAFQGKAVSAIESATTAIENFDVAPLVEMASAAADGIMKFAGVLVGAVKTVWQFRYVIIAIAAPIAAYNIALMIGIGIADAYNKIIEKNTAATALWSVVLQAGAVIHKIYAWQMQNVSAIIKILHLDIVKAKVATLSHAVATKIATATQKAYAFTTSVLSKALKLLKLDFIAAKIHLVALAVAQKAAAAAQWLLNVAMNMNPIGLVVIAIGTLIGVIIALVKWGKMAAGVFITIATIFTGPVGLAIGLVISAFVELIKGWGSVTKAFKDGGILAGLRQIGALLLSGILAPIQGLLELLAKIPGVDKLLGPAIEELNDFRNKLKGIEAPVIEAEVKIPETDFDKLTKEFVIAMPEMPDMDYPGFGIPGIGSVPGTGKLHGVEDISKGPSTITHYYASIPANAGGAIPAVPVTAVNLLPTPPAVAATPAQSPQLEAITLTKSALDILQRIDAGVSLISRSLPVSVRAELPKMNAPEIANVINVPIPDMGVSYTTTSVINNAVQPGASAIPATLTGYIISIAAALQRIDASVSAIARGLPPAARMELPKMNAPEIANVINVPIPDMGISYTTTSVINNAIQPGASAIPATLTGYIISIAAALQRIGASVSAIARSLPPAARMELPKMNAPETATRTSLALPRINMGGDNGSADYNPRAIAPITQAERTAYSFHEERKTIVIEVAAEKGTTARIVRAPRDVDIQLVTSGGNA